MKDINNIFLPSGSENEEVESISRKRFIQLFDAARFIIKDESIDNGIDFRSEIVKESHKLGFGFNFQLKAKIEAIKNSDGSYSKSLETSNIEYLINNGQPAFYGFYVKNEDKIYYEDLNIFIKSLHDKSISWEDQPNHTLRFTKILDEAAVNNIYNIALNQGKLLRELTYRLAIESSTNANTNKILINFDKSITDDNEIRKMIEGIGLDLINEAKWNEILHVHKKASGNVASTAKYNLILGIANYYSSNIIDAISFFKSSMKNIHELSDELKKHLQYFDIVSKYAVGIISKGEYNNKIKDFENSDNIGFHVKLEQAKNDYASKLEVNENDSYNYFVNELQQIIDNPKASDSVKLLAKCDLMLYEGYKNNMDYVREVSMINAIEGEIGPNVEMRFKSASRFISVNESWFKSASELKKEAHKNKDFIVYYNVIINEIKINYELKVFSDLVKISQEIPNQSPRPMPNKEPFFDSMLSNLKHVYSYYLGIGHIENVVVILSIKYEIEHYLEDYNSAQITLDELEGIVSTIDSTEVKRKLEVLKQQGTTHERFKQLIDNIFDKSNSNKAEVKQLITKMEKMDEDEKVIDFATFKYLHIHLFPIGYFKFPEDRLEEVLSTLHIDESVTKDFKFLYKNEVIPIANIFNDTILCEGFGEGTLADKGIDSWRNIYRIREYFFEKKFLRAHINFTPNLFEI